MEDMVREFVGESRENCDQIDLDLVALEQRPDDRGVIARIFRAIHTIKGTCGFLGFGGLESVAHAAESVLSALRDEEIAPTPELTTTLLAFVDVARGLLDRIDATGHEGEADHGELVAQLTALVRPGGATYAALAVAASAGELLEVDSSEPHETRPTPGRTVNGGKLAPAAAMSDAGETSIRVDVALLDRLMNLVGELVLARNQIVQFTGANGDATFIAAAQQLNLITAELQDGVMKTRMQPIGNIWHKFPRVVRDLALACDKRLELVLEGESTELDKTLIEAIKDPLTHLVRNAVDHGIERVDRRLAAGKPAQGRLVLRAYHEGGQVNIEVIDDGAGLDAARIRDKAIERGIITAEQADRMSERELCRLVFLPGFSTAETVTNLSGRGVGMDVVRTNIERIGGTIELAGTRGVGSTIKIKIPLTLAIIPALVVSCGDNRYAIPQASLLELVRLAGDQARDGVETLYGTPVYRLRGKLLPLLYLSDALDQAVPHNHDEVYIVVLQADDRQFGLVVDSVCDTEEIVVKPLGKHLKTIPVFAGATIMGDGKVALILDILGLAKRGRVVAEGEPRGRLEAAEITSATDNAALQTVLVVRSPDDGRMAIPLSRVARLEELRRDIIERVGPELLVQYRGEIMPVVELSTLLLERRPSPRTGGPPAWPELVQVVVFAHAGVHVGLIVEQILDVVEHSLASPRRPGRPGVLGSVVIAGRVTELLDVEVVLRRARPGAAWAERDDVVAGEAVARGA